MTDTPTTRLCRHADDRIALRGRDLVGELIGEVGFTAALFHHILGRIPSPGEVRIVDAVLVTLMEHGLTPSAIAARLVYMSSPEALQAGVAAGLLAVGGRFVGTMEGTAALLDEIVAATDRAAAARRIAEAHREARRPVPGFGHHLHRPDDPRTPKLLAVARAEGVPGAHIAALEALAAAVDAAVGKHVTINATGAIAAVLREIGVPARLMRGFAVISRAAGLVGHIAEEQARPAAGEIWRMVDRGIAYEGE